MNYDIIIRGGALSDTGELVSNLVPKCKALVITDDIVDALYGNAVRSSLSKADYDVFSYVVKHGEQNKNLSTLGAILEFAAENRLTRSDIIVALGGGVVGDMAGMAAAVYLRGIKYVQIPTTFLAAIDSSVGGKTAVNLGAGKNLAGAFWQPSLVICDSETLKTLPEDVFADGVAEAIKYGMIWDETLFERLSSGSFSGIDDIISSCVNIKSIVVAQDERDTGIRQILNFGHTIGHAIEKLSDFTISHGKAVAIGMAIITRASETMGLTEAGTTTKLHDALMQNNLPTSCNFGAEELFSALTGDKKRQGNTISLVLVDKIGHATLHKTDIGKVRSFISLGLEGGE